MVMYVGMLTPFGDGFPCQAWAHVIFSEEPLADDSFLDDEINSNHISTHCAVAVFAETSKVDHVRCCIVGLLKHGESVGDDFF